MRNEVLLTDLEHHEKEIEEGPNTEERSTRKRKNEDPGNTEYTFNSFTI